MREQTSPTKELALVPVEAPTEALHVVEDPVKTQCSDNALPPTAEDNIKEARRRRNYLIDNSRIAQTNTTAVVEENFIPNWLIDIMSIDAAYSHEATEFTQLPDHSQSTGTTTHYKLLSRPWAANQAIVAANAL